MTTSTTTSSTALDDLLDAYKREVALPGTFAATYPGVGDDDILGALADAFAECQLDGWFGTYQLNLRTFRVSPGLTPAARALVVIYAGMRWVRTEIRGLKTSTRYKAGPVEYEVQQGVGALTQLLKDLAARRDNLLTIARAGAGATYVLDAYTTRGYAGMPGGFAPLELPSGGGIL